MEAKKAQDVDIEPSLGVSSSGTKPPMEADVSYSSDTFDDISMSGSGSKGKDSKSLQYLKQKASAKPTPIEESSDRYETDEFTSISQSHNLQQMVPPNLNRGQSQPVPKKPQAL